MCKLCWVLSGILFLLVAAMGYLFLIKGDTVASSDGRSAIVLPEGERDLVLTEMRAFLAAVQGVIVAANKEDMAAVAKYAKGVGSAAQQDVPVSLMKKLPLGFKKLGLGTHKAFDQLAMDATDLGDPGHTMAQLGELMKNCVACHAAYRIEPEIPH